DAERECDHCDNRKRSVFGKHASAVSDVLQERFEKAAALNIVSRIAGSIDVAIGAHCVFSCLPGRHSRPDVCLYLQFDVRAHLAIDLIDNHLALPQRSQPIANYVEPLHIRSFNKKSLCALCAFLWPTFL